MTRRRRLTILVLAIGVTGCQAAIHDAGGLALAAAASDSLTLALADSIAPSQGFVVSPQGGPALSACNDRVEGIGWESVGSRIVEMELPPYFTAAPQSSQSASWTGPSGSIRVSSHRGGNHGWWSDKITSECDVYISGSPAHIDLVTTQYGRYVFATIRVNDAPAIEMEGQAKNMAAQGEMLHSIRTARISAAWGRPE